MAEDSTFTRRFVTEAREHLAAMSSVMVSLEGGKASPGPLIEQLLRAAHSVKGGAGLVGRKNIERLAHQFEEVTERIRDGSVSVTPEVIDTLLSTIDRMMAMIDDVDRSDEVDISESCASLRSIIDQKVALPAVTTRRDFHVPDQLLETWTSQSAHVYGVKIDWWQCERQCGLPPLAVAERLEGCGRVVEARTNTSGKKLREGLPEPPFWHLAVICSPDSLETFTRKLDIPCAEIVQLSRESKVAETPSSPSVEAPRSRAAGSSLRVSVPLVDKMMALAGELVLVRNQALRSSNSANPAERRLLRRLDSVTNELQDAALRMRTQPVATLFDRFPRVVRDLARQLGKQIDVRISGSEVELDKTILELLADPLTHLVRNCCDHGIEPPPERAKAGKPPVGRIDLSARQERGQIVIEVRDDGRGIDVRAIKRKALEHGVKRSDELDRMADQQVFGLILLSGFSTAKQLTDLSGRGVGMDVVKTNIDQAGGVVEIDSAAGSGSVFTLRLPLTLAIMPCLLLGSEGRCYGVPQRDVEEILLLGEAQNQRRVERGHAAEVIRWRGRLLPVVRAREILHRRAPFDQPALAEVAERYHGGGTRPSTGYAAVIRLGTRRFAAVFDEVLGSENIVVKPLHPLLRPLGIYAATTILGDGRVALIFGAEGVARHAGVADYAVTELASASPAVDSAKSDGLFLLFRCGAEELFASRVTAVRRIVTIDANRIERVGGREMVTVDGAPINVVRLNRFLDVSPCVEKPTLFLLLPRATDASFGLLVSEIIDTRTLSPDVDSRAYQAEGIAGTMIVTGEIALLIDLDRIEQMWRSTSRAGPPALAASPGARILVAEDTQFFQKLIGEVLRGAGYEVNVVENGQEAFATLQKDRFDVVVSDIEMPLMSGLELARAVRADARLAQTPMIALTTLNTAESRAEAAQSGFDLYQVKLDPHQLLSAIGDLLPRAGQQSLVSRGSGHA
jgi:two-component system, chemotaxis family, sensor kinase CheA